MKKILMIGTLLLGLNESIASNNLTLGEVKSFITSNFHNTTYTQFTKTLNINSFAETKVIVGLLKGVNKNILRKVDIDNLKNAWKNGIEGIKSYINLLTEDKLLTENNLRLPATENANTTNNNIMNQLPIRGTLVRRGAKYPNDPNDVLYVQYNTPYGLGYIYVHPDKLHGYNLQEGDSVIVKTIFNKIINGTILAKEIEAPMGPYENNNIHASFYLQLFNLLNSMNLTNQRINERLLREFINKNNTTTEITPLDDTGADA